MGAASDATVWGLQCVLFSFFCCVTNNFVNYVYYVYYVSMGRGICGRCLLMLFVWPEVWCAGWSMCVGACGVVLFVCRLFCDG